MIGSYPITWLITELLAIVLFTLCLFHALKHENYKQRVFELMCWIIGTGIFENVGVNSGLYSYDQHRILMVGLVPLSILMIEAVIFYAAFVLFEYLNMPKWSVIWVVGFLGAFQDMSIDPVYVHDAYLYNGALSGQWNWVLEYDGSFFGIPYWNFSGWVYMAIYAGLILLGRWAYEKYNNKTIGIAYPFLAGLLLMLPLGIAGKLLVIAPSRNLEILKLVTNYAFAIVLMTAYWRRMRPIDLRKDMIIFIVPIALRLYDLVVAFSIKITTSYVPVIVCSGIHFTYLFYLYKKARKAKYILPV